VIVQGAQGHPEMGDIGRPGQKDLSFVVIGQTTDGLAARRFQIQAWQERPGQHAGIDGYRAVGQAGFDGGTRRTGDIGRAFFRGTLR